MEDSEQQQFKALLEEVVGAEVAATTPICDRGGLQGLAQALRTVAVRLRSGDPSRISKNTDAEWGDVKRFLWGVGNVNTITTDYSKGSFQLKAYLNMISEPANKFEERYRELTKYLLDKFAQQNWGVPAEAEKKSTSKTKKRRAEDDQNAEKSAKKQNSGTLDKSTLKRAPKSHEIYGENGIMRGILWYRSGNSSQYALDNKYPAKDARVYGDNGIDVGAWFPRQLAALRDGAHGEKQGGVSGDVDKGAFSIVVNKGGYGGIDKDEGDVITYSAPGAFDTQATRANIEERGAKCLLSSFATKNPVRVLRGQTGWKLAPFCGYRYDGLYTVTEKGEGKNKQGGVYIWVKLVRNQNQDPIPKRVPNKVQRDQEEKVSKGY